MALYPAGNVNPVRSTGLRHAYQKYIIRWGLDRGWCSCAVRAQRVMNKETSMGCRQTRLTGRGCWSHPFTRLNVTCGAPRRLSASLPRAAVQGPPGGCNPHLHALSSLPSWPALLFFQTASAHPRGHFKGTYGNATAERKTCTNGPRPLITDMG